MQKNISILVILMLLFSLILIPYENVKADIIYVDDDGGAEYTKIQDAIDNASNGDTIYVFNGTYYENININKYNLNLIGENKNSTIIDANGSGYGVQISQDMISLIDFMIRNAGVDGIIIHGRANNYILNCKIYNTSSNGLRINHNSNNNIIENCEIFDSQNNGILLKADSSSNYVDNTQIINSKLYNNSYYGIMFDGDRYKRNNIILRSECYNNSMGGIKTSGGNVNDNSFINTQCYYNTGDGLYTYGHNNKIINCSFQNNSEIGLHLHDADNVLVENISSQDNLDCGCKIYSLATFNVLNSTFNDNLYGILVDVSYIGLIYNCTTNNNNWEGILLDSSYDIEVKNCTSNNNYNGVNLVDNVYHINITGCLFSNNSYYGIHTIQSNNNLIYNNYFNNANNAYELLSTVGNTWNITKTSGNNIVDGPYLGGNYWSDFDESGEGAFDANSDGIVDSPYSIPEGSSMDYYPLMPYTPLGPTYWSAMLNFNESTGLSDYVVFGEDPNASDGQDLFDVPSPPDPDVPYINAWFDAGLVSPYDKLIEDYRFYPDNGKIWDLYLVFNNSEPISSDNITISWDIGDLVSSEYYNGSILLENLALAETVDMLSQSIYTFDANLDTIYHLLINCTSNQPPVANFTYEPFHPAAGDNIFFNDTSFDPDGYIVNWSWSFGDGSISYDQNTTHTYSVGGTYSVTLNVTDNDGTTDSITKMINVYDSIQLKYRWNLISAPSGMPIDKSQIIIRYNNNDYNWSEAVIADIILDYFYGWNRTSQLYTLNDSLDPGYGYWIWSYYDCEMLLSHNPLTDDYITGLKYRWNLLGLPFTQQVDKNSIFVNYSGINYTWQQATTDANIEGEPLILEFIYNWNRSIQNYELTDTLVPGYGYWMYAYYNCSLIRNPPPYTLTSISNKQEINRYYKVITNESLDSWNLRLDISETGGAADYVTLAEKPDALDGKDSSDIPKCPSGLTPYIRAWFTSQETVPYNKLWMDYKKYPGTEKEWNLNIQWVPRDYTSPTEMTIKWDNNYLSNTEYKTIVLYDVEEDKIVSNMNQYNQYTFTCSALNLNKFKIKCLEGDTLSPMIQLIKPIHGLYLLNRKIIPLAADSIVIGTIDVDVNATDEYGIAKVEFFINNKLKATDDTEPYSWTWSKFSFSWHTLKVIAFDNAGNTRSEIIKVWKFF